MENITKYLTADIRKENLKDFKEILKRYENLINTKNFSKVYYELLTLDGNWACSLFTLLCVNSDINPFMHTGGKIPANSLFITIKDAGASLIANRLSEFLSNLPPNTTISDASDYRSQYSQEYFKFESITFNNIHKIYPNGLCLQGNFVKLNNNGNINIKEYGLYADCHTLHINAKYLDIYAESIFGEVSELYLNVDDILCGGTTYHDFDSYGGLDEFKVTERVFISEKLAKKYPYEFFRKLFNCNEVKTI